MKIGVTGDVHGDLMFNRFFQVRRQNYDMLIVCGDFGYIWDGSLKEHHNKVDYILTHACPSNMLKHIGGEYGKDEFTDYLQWNMWINTFGL